MSNEARTDLGERIAGAGVAEPSESVDRQPRPPGDTPGSAASTSPPRFALPPA